MKYHEQTHITKYENEYKLTPVFRDAQRTHANITTDTRVPLVIEQWRTIWWLTARLASWRYNTTWKFHTWNKSSENGRVRYNIIMYVLYFLIKNNMAYHEYNITRQGKYCSMKHKRNLSWAEGGIEQWVNCEKIYYWND